MKLETTDYHLNPFLNRQCRNKIIKIPFENLMRPAIATVTLL